MKSLLPLALLSHFVLSAEILSNFHPPSGKEKTVVLTFDACGGPGGWGYDEALIQTLCREKIPATLFITALWASRNSNTFAALKTNALFEIENHGASHRPLSASGQSIYGLLGTPSLDEARREVQGGAAFIQKETGRRPKFFRPAALYFENETSALVEKLGYRIAAFSVNGDAGASFSPAQVKKTLLAAKTGDIVIFHMNHPEGGTAQGIREALENSAGNGFRFVRLSDVSSN
ncbi:MAG: polysaccharide deacetylase family protein [Spirochaetia bacterium]|nr:polysaccharide deacetylase family protein [Spirochaetia bacterium]